MFHPTRGTLPFNKPEVLGDDMGRKVCAILLVLTVLLPLNVSGHGDESHEEGNIVDVLVLDSNCEENQTCVNRPSNFVEYFGADWCTNCPQVETLLEGVDYNETLIKPQAK